MKFKFFKIGLIVLLFLVSLVPLTANNSIAKGNEIYVNGSYFGYSDGTADKPYKTIQKAIDVASDGDTIYIFGGLYQENIVVDKKLKIVGSVDEVDTIIDSRFDQRYVVEITADEVTLESVTVSDSDNRTTSPIGALIALKSDGDKIINNYVFNTTSYGIYVASNSGNNLISSNIINKTKNGIYIASSNTNDIVDNNISNCSNYGIYMEYSTGNNRIYGNNIKLSSYGLYIKSCMNTNITNNTITSVNSYSIYLANSNNCLINVNRMTNSTGDGIYLKSSSNCVIKSNTFIGNKRGIIIQGNNNDIYENYLKDQSASGVYILAGTSLNKLYKNSFVNNGKSAQDYGNNQWYYEEQGNYWSDYNYIDILPENEPDGIGDKPYSKNGVLDLYPLGYFLKPPEKPSDPSPEDFETGVGLSITLQVKVKDPDSDELTVYFYRADDNTLIQSTTQNPVEHVQNNSIAECKFTLGFDTIFTWYAVVDDGLLQNRTDPLIFSTRKNPPDNDPPIADAGGPYFIEVGDEVQFDSSGSYDPDGEITFYRWNFGDGSSEILEENPAHVYKNPMEYQVTLTVIDNNGSSASSDTYVSVGTQQNDPPVAKINLIETAKTGEQIIFDSSGTYDPDGDSLTYLWNFGNGETSTLKNPTYSYSTPGTYNVVLAVSDGEYTNTTESTIQIQITKKKSTESPGFELLVMIAAFAILAITIKRKKK